MTAKRPSPVTVERRTVLEWLGGAAVLSLGAPLLAACDSAGTAPGTDTRPAGDGATSSDTAVLPDAAAADSRADAAAVDGGPTDLLPPIADGGFSFQPGPGTAGAYNGWPERTVEYQDLAKILASWTLKVDGMVQQPQELTFAQLVGLPRQDQVTDFHCVEGWSVYDVPWSGVHISKLLAQAKPLGSATHVTFHTIGGKYNESLPLPVALEPRTMLAYGAVGSTLPLKHGFPLRVVIPRLLGYKNAKYVERLELTDKPINGFWVQAGYDYDGEVPPGRLRPGKY